MAKVCSIERNNKRKKLASKYANKRAELKTLISDKSVSLDERFQAALKLAELPRNSARNRIRNRCELTGRPHGYFRKFKLSRIQLRKFGGEGLIPGLIKASW